MPRTFTVEQALGPLRRVVAWWTVDGRLRERYACGHEAWAKTDFYGETVAVRRRCRRCRDAARICV